MPPLDRIELRGLRAVGRHGVFAEEQERGQPFVVDVALELNLGPAARSDDLADTVDYGTLGAEVVAAVERTRFDLIEALAGHVATLALAKPGVVGVTVTVHKPHAPMSVPFDDVAVVVHRLVGA
jgi:dihydroneopterin aldolase